jgi:hypothetical protein
MAREPWTTEFNQEHVKRTPEEYVIAANVRRRHLTPAQKAAIAVEWAERVDKDWAEGRSNTFVARVDKTGAQGGRPKITALQDTAALVGVSVSAAYEARRVKLANETLFAELKAGRRSLGSALDEIQPLHQSPAMSRRCRPPKPLRPRRRSRPVTSRKPSQPLGRSRLSQRQQSQGRPNRPRRFVQPRARQS